MFKIRFKVDRRRVQGGVALRTNIDGSTILRNLFLESEDSTGYDEGMVEATKRVRPYKFEDIIVTGMTCLASGSPGVTTHFQSSDCRLFR